MDRKEVDSWKKSKISCPCTFKFLCLKYCSTFQWRREISFHWTSKYFNIYPGSARIRIRIPTKLKRWILIRLKSGRILNTEWMNENCFVLWGVVTSGPPSAWKKKKWRRSRFLAGIDHKLPAHIHTVAMKGNASLCRQGKGYETGTQRYFSP